ncbi:MAG: TMEM175 family protein [Solirubrobacterales bacterium]
MPRHATAKGREENEVEFARIVAFSDGVFAIAITLLVLDLHIKSGLESDKEVWNAIGDQWENLLAFGISFAVIGRFWIVHHRFFGQVTAFDGRLLWINLLYLCSIVLIPFSSKVLGEYGSDTAGVVVYAINLSATVLIGLWMAADAQGAGLTRTGPEEWRAGWITSLYIAAVFLLSIPVAFIAPNLGQLMWLVLFLNPSRWLAPRAASPD